MTTRTTTQPLDLQDLAERWKISIESARRRIRTIGLPGFNVGTEKEPDWRFRLAAVEAWEAANERQLAEAGAEASPSVPVKAAPPLAWDGISRTGRVGKPKAKAGGR